VEVRCGQRRLATRRRAIWLHVRGRLPAAPHRQRSEPRHGVVLDHRHRVAEPASSLRCLAGPGELRRTGRPAKVAGRHPEWNTRGCARIAVIDMAATKAALERGHTVDITTTGRRSGMPRTIESL